PAFAEQVIDDTIAVIEFETEIALTLSLQLRQATEESVWRSYWEYEFLPPTVSGIAKLDAQRALVQQAALRFRTVANADPEFVIYKTVVGYNSVYAPAWEDKSFRYQEATRYRDREVERLLASVKEEDAERWYLRLNRYAESDSTDAAVFPVLGKFL